MHIHVVPNRNAAPTVLLRESFREGSKVRKRTLANLSGLSAVQIDGIRMALRGETLHTASQALEISQSRAHGHVHAVQLAMQRLGFASVLGSKPSRERDLVLAMVAARIVAPATTRLWHTSTLASDFGVADADENDLYAAMDWLLERQDVIQKKVADRHLVSGGLVLYDLSSSYFEGYCCPLAKRGYSRNGEKDMKGMLQVNYGLMTDARGCPVAVSVHEGNTTDSKTLVPEVKRVREQFGIEHLVMVGDRGMIGHKTIAELRQSDGVGWITALKSVSIRSLVEQGAVQMDLFDERNLVELQSPEYPGERLMACRNPSLAQLRAHKRESLLAATEGLLQTVQKQVESGKLRGADKIGMRVGKVINKHKVAKHFDVEMTDDSFGFSRKQEAIEQEAALDDIYIMRTSLTKQEMAADECVRNYKNLSNVERAFRSLKTVDLKVRPIHHHTADRVRAHILLCMLAYYVEWHMREAWRELMFADTEQAAKATRDPVAPAQRSQKALKKISTKQLEDGTKAHSFATLMAGLATIVRNTCRTPGVENDTSTFEITTTADAEQQRALELIRGIRK